MRSAYRVDTVRAAERALMDTLPDGTLMQRAAAGLAADEADAIALMGRGPSLLAVIDPASLKIKAIIPWT